LYVWLVCVWLVCVGAVCQVWDMRVKNPCTHTFTGHESDVNAVDFFPDGNVVGTGSEDARCVTCRPEWSVAFSPVGCVFGVVFVVVTI
jgi:WD40 repeat protein